MVQPYAGLDVRRDKGSALLVDRNGSDGVLVDLYRDDAAVASVTSFENIISYNSFTGSFYAWTANPRIEPYSVVSMTGKNRHLHNNRLGTVLLGVEETTVANDPNALGVYLSREEPSIPAGDNNPDVVMAIGVGWVCVVPDGGDIRLGDELISSPVRGCAMKLDPRKYPVGYVIGRAVENVNWSNLKADSDGRRASTIAVILDRHVSVRSSGDDAAEQQRQAMKALQTELRSLQERLSELESGRIGAVARSD